MISKKSTNKRMLLILAVVFILPVVLAKLALDNNWFTKAATNKGQLLTPPLALTVLPDLGADSKWHIFYVLPPQCDQACDNALYSLGQVWLALGKESDRVESLVISTPSSDQAAVDTLSQQSVVKLLKSNEENVNSVFKNEPTDGIFIADTLNNVILRYPLYLNQQQAILHSRDILSDMRKLLKLSRIG
ncbi:MAG: hypothetical protein ACJA13_001106 [Paraglaciecola sp.]|jgi:hypothetical protein